MRLLITCISFLILSETFGQNFTYPIIKPTGHSITEFIPPGWIALDSAIGDLNNDKLADLALIIQSKDSVTITKSQDGSLDTVITQPRILLIAFKATIDDQYFLVEQNNSFILNHDDPIMDDPYQTLEINNRILQIGFHIWQSMGSYTVTNTKYKFRYQSKEFVLVGADDNSYSRSTGEIDDYSYNFLAKKVKISSGDNISGDSEKRKVKWKSIDIKKLKTLKTFKQPYTWEVMPDFYL